MNIIHTQFVPWNILFVCLKSVSFWIKLFVSLKILYVNQKRGKRRKQWALKMDGVSSSEKRPLLWRQNAVLQHTAWDRICRTVWKIKYSQFLTCKYLPRTSESIEFAFFSRTSQLNPHKEAIARVCDNYTEHISPLCGHNADFLMFNLEVLLTAVSANCEVSKMICRDLPTSFAKIIARIAVPV
jgi:hypothetical protein